MGHTGTSERVTEYLLSTDDKKQAIRQAELDKQLRKLDQDHHQEMRRVQTEATTYAIHICILFMFSSY